jgi:hypothetical protein
MPEYDATRFQPPAPVASVILKSPTTNQVVSGVPM